MSKSSFRLALSAAIIVAGAAMIGSPAVAAEGPPGFQVLCILKPAECKGGGASQVAVTDAMMATMTQVNRRVNRAIRPKSDGRVDVWSVNVKSGDCEDYALAKRRQLIDAGVPASSLRIAYVKTRSGVDHAILVVNTSKGKFVLDNLNSSVVPLSQTRYRVMSMQTANPLNWT